jgi:hypothetical protein
MLGLNTKNGWRAGLTVAVAGTLIGLGGGAAFAAPAVTKAEAQGVNATGQLVEILDTGDCKTTAPVAYPGTGPRCGEGLSTDTVSAFSQAVQGSATSPGSLQGTPWAQSAQILQGKAYSRGYASVAPIDIDGLGEVSLTNIFDGLAAADTGTILDPVLNALGDPIATTLAPVLTPLSDGLQAGLDGVNGALPTTIQLGAVESQCQATGSPLRASASSNVADANLVVGEGVLGADGVVVPLNGPNGADTPPNTNLLIGAPQDLVDAVLDTLQDSLNVSLDGAGAPLNALLNPVQDQVVDAILAQLEPTLLTQLADALEPLVSGTVNKQTPNPTSVSNATGTNNTGKVEVIALEVKLLAAGGNQTQQTLQLGRSACGVNSAGSNGGTPGLQFDKDGTTDGGDAKFTLTVHNSTNSAINNVFVQDFYGNDIDAKDIKGVKVSQGSFNKNTGRWTVGTLGAGKTAKLTFKVDVDSSDLNDGVKNAACVNKANKPGHIQKNDGVADDTDGCDEDTSKKDDDSDDSDNSDDSDDSDGPKSVDSGLNDGGNLGALAITGLLAASTLVGSAARQRLLLDR